MTNCPSSPNLARVYDWLLGGTDNERADHMLGEQLTILVPRARDFARINRDLTRRIVRMAEADGIKQFIDVGAGLPTRGAVPEVAGSRARVVMVDNDLCTVDIAERIVHRDCDPARHRVLFGDLLTPRTLWAQACDTGLIDSSQPVCVLATAFLHFVKDGTGLSDRLAELRSLLGSGSLLALSHSTEQDAPDDPITPQAARFHGRIDPGQLRDRGDLEALLGDFTLLEPGVVFAGCWRPDPATVDPFSRRPALSHTLAAVGRKQ